MILKNIIARHIANKDIFWLFNQVINSFNTKSQPNIGLPLGNLTSQLLVNVFMNEFDQFVKRELKAKHYIRYADDFVFLSHDRKQLEGYVEPISRFLSDKLNLELHPKKLYIKTLSSSLDFQGWVHFPYHRVIRTKTKHRILRRLEKNFNNDSFQSYLGVLSHGNTYKIRRRLHDKLKIPRDPLRGKRSKNQRG